VSGESETIEVATAVKAPTPLVTKPSPSSSAAPVGPTKSTSTTTSASSPSPEKVCAHVAAVFEKEAGGVPGTADQKESLYADCLKEAQKQRVDDPKGYACDSACLLAAKDFADIQTCKSKC